MPFQPSENTFWRAKYAREHTKKYLYDQIIGYISNPAADFPIPPNLPPVGDARDDMLASAGAPVDAKQDLPSSVLKTSGDPEPDRPPLYQVPSPIPILKGPTDGGNTPNAPEGTPELPLVGIIGAGAAGLYTAMIFEDLGIKYEILEGSDRPGGRLYTHHFKDGKSPWNYYASISFDQLYI
jgi:hypothetical protein